MSAGEIVEGRFELLQVAGSGGMGTVYRARDRVSGAAVALKLMHADGNSMRFAREAQVLATIEHPGIVRYVAHGLTQRGEPYLAMEWLDGEDLASRLRRGPLAIAEVLALARRTAEILAAMHARGIVHRDIKPSNLFLSGAAAAGPDVGEVKILDFGVVRASATRSLSAVGSAIGTPAYMAPEQARGDRGVDARADVYSLGCVLFECLTGTPPFGGEHAMAVLVKALLEKAPRASEQRSAVPAALDALIARMLEKDPAARPADGGAVLHALSTLSEAASVAPPAPGRGTPAITAAEQRVLGIVLTQGESVLDATLSPEEQRAISAALRRAVLRHGGHVELYASGALVATIASDGAPTDLAARAARVALAVAAIQPLASVGLAIGRGVVARSLPAGDVIDRAAALAAGESPSSEEPAKTARVLPGVWIDGATAALLEGRFVVEMEEGRRRLAGERDAIDTRRRLLGRRTSCVGRERELHLLAATLLECIEEPAARAVLVTGQAGMGKSRIVQEALEQASLRHGPVEVLVARGDALGAGSPFALAGQIVRRAAGAAEGAPPEEKRARIHERIARCLGAEDGRRVAELLGEIAGARAPDAEASEALRAARSDPIVMGDAIRAAWEDWLAAEASAGALVVVLEDLHWGDLPSLQLVDAALRNLSDQPIFVLATARPEVHETFPSLWAERDVIVVQLGVVTRKASERLVREVMGPDVAEATVALLVARAGGHPFLLEELIRAASEGEERSLSDGILGMLQARLDALGADAKRLLRAASVVGETFWTGAVAALLGEGAGALSARLDELAAREILERRRASSLPGETEHVFRHALLRDAAYAMLTDEDRALGHRLAGEWLAGAGVSDPVVLAEHAARAGDAARALGFYRRAAEQALEGNDLAAAIARAQQAMACGPAPEVRAALLLLVGEASYWRGELDEAERAAGAAADALPEGTDAWFDALSARITASGQRGDNDRVEACLDRALAAKVERTTDAQIVCLCRGASQLAYAHRDAKVRAALAEIEARLAGGVAPLAEGWLHRARGEDLYHSRNLEGCLAELAAAQACFERAGARRYLCVMRILRGTFAAMAGHIAAVPADLAQGLADAERLGAPYLRAFGAIHLATCQLHRRDLPALAEALATCDGARGGRLGFLVDFYRSVLAFERGEMDAAEQHARRAAGAKVGALVRAAALGMIARSLVARGRAEEALAIAEQAFEMATEDHHEHVDGFAQLAKAEALDALGRRDEAALALRPALDRMEAVARTFREPGGRERYLARPLPNAELSALARAWGLS